METKVDKASFWAAALSLAATFVASATPIPLYGTYQRVDGVSYFELSLSSVVYFVGAVTALLIFGRLSNHLGRRPVSIMAVVLAAMASASFLHVHDAAPLLIGRLLQGLACGLASTALAAWIVDCAHTVPKWLAPAVISCGPMTGLTIGGVISGVLVEYGPIPRQLPFYLVLVLLAVCVALILRGKETMPSAPGAIGSLKPRMGLPAKAKKFFPVAAVTFVSTWALGGFFQAFGPAMANEQLHSSNAVAAALVFASIMAPSTVGASIAGKMKATTAQFYGMISFAVFVGGLLLALQWGILVMFLIASVLAGIAQGMVLTGSIQTMVSSLEPKERANVLSVIYATSYTGAAIPTLIAGRMSESYSLLQVACGYGVLALVGAVTVILARKYQQREFQQCELNG
ncbi:MFS transporter [Shewanella mangrovi]|uniref:MFS transporter n=1 Tax=Shewanella mangrovi TaxID=1515746 RepID=UPI000B0E63B7|nr:MFS transporter [Shewanella mangrovi]